MNIKRQVALIIAPPIIFLLITPIYGATVGWNGYVFPALIAASMILASICLSYFFARPVLKKVSELSRAANGLHRANPSLLSPEERSGDVLADAPALFKKITKDYENAAQSNVALSEVNAMLDALDRSQARIDFNIDGTIITANEQFLDAVGYNLDEIKGQNHSMFVDADYKDGAEYRAFWEALRRGEFQAGAYKRVGKGGKEIWIQASYNPIFDHDGKPVKVVKFASDVTAAELAKQEAVFKSTAFGGSSVAMMMVDRDFTVTDIRSGQDRRLVHRHVPQEPGAPASAHVGSLAAALSHGHRHRRFPLRPERQRRLR